MDRYKKFPMKWGIVGLLVVMFFVTIPYNEGLGAFEEQEDYTFLVKYKEGARILSEIKYSGNLKERKQVTQEIEKLVFDTEEEEAAIQKALESQPFVERVERDVERYLLETPNDPYFTAQWWLPHVHAPSMWSLASAAPKDTVVAVIDTGIEDTHEDLQNRIAPAGYNFFHGDDDVTDIHGHGTRVAGVVAAEMNNGVGGIGVAGSFNTSVLPLKVLHAGDVSYVSALIQAIDYAVAQDVEVINLSLGGPQISTLENEAIQRAIEAGIVVVAAAGNDALKGNPVNYPAAYDNVFSIGAVNRQNTRASFSAYNDYVDFVAPGESITTTTLAGKYASVSGTSFAAPIVAGTVAAMRALDPLLTIEEVGGLLKTTATDLGALGRDAHYGDGLINLETLSAVLQPFPGDFSRMLVEDDKVFTIRFNQPLHPEKDYREDIVISHHADGRDPVSTIQTVVNPQNPYELFVSPTTKWDADVHYMTISKTLQNANGGTLADDVTMKFFSMNE